MGGRFWRGALGTAGALAAMLASLPASADLKMRLEWTPSIHHSWFFIAEEKGWYKEEGVKVTIEPGSGSVSTIQIVASGSHDIGQASHSALAVGRSKNGLKVKAIGALLRKNEMGILVPQGSGWKSPKDLVDNNVKILVSPGGFDTPFFEPWFKLAGTDHRKANFVYVDANLCAGGSAFKLEVNSCCQEAEPNGTPATANALCCPSEASITQPVLCKPQTPTTNQTKH